MSRYRKKPVEIEAMLISELINTAMNKWDELPQWVKDAYHKGVILLLPSQVVIETLEGNMHGLLSDYLIRGVRGELYPCKPGIFEETYEKVTQLELPRKELKAWAFVVEAKRNFTRNGMIRRQLQKVERTSSSLLLRILRNNSFEKERLQLRSLRII